MKTYKVTVSNTEDDMNVIDMYFTDATLDLIIDEITKGRDVSVKHTDNLYIIRQDTFKYIIESL